MDVLYVWIIRSEIYVSMRNILCTYVLKPLSNWLKWLCTGVFIHLVYFELHIALELTGTILACCCSVVRGQIWAVQIRLVIWASGAAPIKVISAWRLQPLLQSLVAETTHQFESQCPSRLSRPRLTLTFLCCPTGPLTTLTVSHYFSIRFI